MLTYLVPLPGTNWKTWSKRARRSPHAHRSTHEEVTQMKKIKLLPAACVLRRSVVPDFVKFSGRLPLILNCRSNVPLFKFQ